MTEPTPSADRAPGARAIRQEDELLLGDKTASVFFYSLLAVGGIVTALTIQSIFLIGWEWNQLSNQLAAGVVLASAWLLRKGSVRLAIQIFLWGLTSIVLINPWFVSGIRTPSIYTLPGLCVMAVWLLGSRQAAVLAAYISASLVAMVVAERVGYPSPGILRPLETHLIIMLGTLLLTFIVTRAAVKSFQGKLQSLQESEERFQALFRANPLPCSTVEVNGATLDVNDAWVSLFGIARDAVQRRSATELGIWRQEDHRLAVRARLAAGQAVADFPTTLHTVYGELPFLLYVSPVESGGSMRLVTTLVDQTDRQAAEAAQHALTESLEERVALRTAELSQSIEALQAAQDELVRAEKLASLGAMVAGISHELNTPVGNALTMASTLKEVSQEFSARSESGAMRKSDLSHYLSNVSEMADLLERNARRAAELISSFKQVAVDRSSQRKRVFDLAQLVSVTLITLQPMVRDRGVVFTQNIAEGLQCDTYPGPLEQILTNLVQNSVVHGFDGRDAGHIDIQARLDGASVVMTVRDDGAGMTEHTLKHVFDPFFTTRLGQGGSGLGLSVSHHLAVAVLGGDLTAASTPGEGCTMTLRFLQKLPHAS